VKAEMNTLQRLEEWKSGHKARSVDIHVDDGYGASCWMVTLYGKNKRIVHASEVSFLVHDRPIQKDVVYVLDGDSDEDWPGLERTINAALDRAEQLGL
jgi:hypothetical protein